MAAILLAQQNYQVEVGHFTLWFTDKDRCNHRKLRSGQQQARFVSAGDREAAGACKGWLSQ